MERRNPTPVLHYTMTPVFPALGGAPVWLRLLRVVQSRARSVPCAFGRRAHAEASPGVPAWISPDFGGVGRLGIAVTSYPRLPVPPTARNPTTSVDLARFPTTAYNPRPCGPEPFPACRRITIGSLVGPIEKAPWPLCPRPVIMDAGPGEVLGAGDNSGAIHGGRTKRVRRRVERESRRCVMVSRGA